MSLLFNMLSRLIITFLPRSNVYSHFLNILVSLIYANVRCYFIFFLIEIFKHLSFSGFWTLGFALLFDLLYHLPIYLLWVICIFTMTEGLHWASLLWHSFSSGFFSSMLSLDTLCCGAQASHCGDFSCGAHTCGLQEL